VVLWDVADPAEPVRIGQPLPGRPASPDLTPGSLSSEFAVSAMAFSADSRTFAVASGVASTVQLWDLTDRQHPFRIGSGLTGSWRAVFTVAFSPDGRVLAAGDRAGAVTVWDLSGVAARGDRVVERACARTGQGLTADEWARYLPDTPYEDTCPE
jgi:WD40 repeat protein